MHMIVVCRRAVRESIWQVGSVIYRRMVMADGRKGLSGSVGTLWLLLDVSTRAAQKKSSLRSCIGCAEIQRLESRCDDGVTVREERSAAAS